jgi:5'-nucleotidase
MLRLAIDMDEVLADTAQKILHLAHVRLGLRLTKKDIVGKGIIEAFPNNYKAVFTWLHQKGFFRDLTVIAGSKGVMKELNAKYDVFIVSAATPYHHSMKEKVEWLNEHFPYITAEQIVFCGDKRIIRADVMIDDTTKNLDHFTGQGFLFNAPHNLLAKGYKRLDGWRDVRKVFLESAFPGSY